MNLDEHFYKVYDDLYNSLYNVLSAEALAIFTGVVIEDEELNRFDYKKVLVFDKEINVRTFVELRNCFLIHKFPEDYYKDIPFIDDSKVIKEYRDTYIKTKIFSEYRGELWQLHYLICATLSAEQKKYDIEVNFDELMTDSNSTFDGLVGKEYYSDCASIAHNIVSHPDYCDWKIKQYSKRGLNFKIK